MKIKTLENGNRVIELTVKEQMKLGKLMDDCVKNTYLLGEDHTVHMKFRRAYCIKAFKAQTVNK